MEFWTVFLVTLLFICGSVFANGNQHQTIEQRFRRQDKLISDLKHTAKEHEITIGELKTALSAQERVCCGLVHAVTRRGVLMASVANKRNAETYVESTYGCPGDELTLSCPEGRHILVETADYGEYLQGCADCCFPYPLDCTELMSGSNTADWVILKLACDNQTTCTYLFQGSTFVSQCTVQEPVHYILVYYTCQPDNSDDTIAFTVFPTESRNYTEEDAIVIFDSALTNTGDHFDLALSMFLCPRAGLYFFSLHIFTTQSQRMIARIMKDASSLTTAYAHNVDGVLISASNSVITECNIGQKIWVRSMVTNSQLRGDSNRYTSFSGFFVKEN